MFTNCDFQTHKVPYCSLFYPGCWVWSFVLHPSWLRSYLITGAVGGLGLIAAIILMERGAPGRGWKSMLLLHRWFMMILEYSRCISDFFYIPIFIEVSHSLLGSMCNCSAALSDVPGLWDLHRVLWWESVHRQVRGTCSLSQEETRPGTGRARYGLGLDMAIFVWKTITKSSYCSTISSIWNSSKTNNVHNIVLR